MNINSNAPIDSVLLAVSERLAVLTRRAGLKKKQLAELAGVNVNTITAVMSGGDMKLSTLIRLSRVLGDTEWLQVLIDEPQPSPMEQLRKVSKRTSITTSAKRPAARRMGRKAKE